MSRPHSLPLRRTLEVRDTCLCFAAQGAARLLARHFDEAFRPLGITSGQFSILCALNRSEPPTIGEVAALLAMDRTTLTAALKPLERRGLVGARADRKDRRSRRLALTPEGNVLLAEAYPAWRAAQNAVDAMLPPARAAGLRAGLTRLARTMRNDR
jgi:DNA-binding MarR family transcriptional regulator